MKYDHADYKDTDDRGRVTLGNEFANSKVAIAWVDVGSPDVDELREPSERVKDKLTELHKWARDNGYVALDFDTDSGKIYTKNAEWVDTDVVGFVE